MGIIGVMMLLSLNFIQAQGFTLTLNRVLLVTSIQSVPANTVWKVEGVFTDQTNFGNQSSTESPAIIINGVKNFYEIPVAIGSGFFAYAPSGFPLWLPAGTSLAASNKIAFVNVLEFKLIP